MPTPDPIPPAPEGYSTAETSALDRARSDGGTRAAIARAMWQRDYQPGPEAQIGGYVYEIADRVADAVLPALHDYLKGLGYRIVHRDVLSDAMAALDDLGACANPCCKDPDCGRVIGRLNTVLYGEEIAVALAELTSIIRPADTGETQA